MLDGSRTGAATANDAMVTKDTGWGALARQACAVGLGVSDDHHFGTSEATLDLIGPMWRGRAQHSIETTISIAEAQAEVSQGVHLQQLAMSGARAREGCGLARRCPAGLTLRLWRK